MAFIPLTLNLSMKLDAWAGYMGKMQWLLGMFILIMSLARTVTLYTETTSAICGALLHSLHGCTVKRVAKDKFILIHAVIILQCILQT